MSVLNDAHKHVNHPSRFLTYFLRDIYSAVNCLLSLNLKQILVVGIFLVIFTFLCV